MSPRRTSSIVPQEHIENRIFVIRGMKVMLDRDLAELYGVRTKVLNQSVKRNAARFPADFMFRLDKEEMHVLRSQIVTSNRGGTRFLPYAFTEHGILMLANVLNTKRAIGVSIVIIRTFIKLRQLTSVHRELAQKLNQLERKYERHDEQIQAIFGQIRELMTFEDKPKRQIGFGK